jgi:hypothetical protein
MLCSVRTLPLCLCCSHVILLLQALWQVGPCSLMFWVAPHSLGSLITLPDSVLCSANVGLVRLSCSLCTVSTDRPDLSVLFSLFHILTEYCRPLRLLIVEYPFTGLSMWDLYLAGTAADCCNGEEDTPIGLSFSVVLLCSFFTALLKAAALYPFHALSWRG